MNRLNFSEIAKKNPKVDVRLAETYVEMLNGKQGGGYRLARPLGGMPSRPQQDLPVIMNRIR